MISEIQSIIATMTGSASTAAASSGAGALFEMWLLLKIAERLRKNPFHAELRNASDNALASGTNFILRGGPGPVGVGQYCHLSFIWGNQVHELHTNIQFRGRSTETHELDIALIPRSVANVLRQRGGGRPSGHSRIAVECKFRSSTGSKDEARQIVARQFDMHFLKLHPYPVLDAKRRIWPESAHHLGHGNASRSYKQSFAHCFNALCRLGPITAPAGIFLSFNHVLPFSNIRPGQQDTVDFLDELEAFLNNNAP